MYSYSKASKLKLTQADEKLQLIAFELIQIMDVTILETLRTQECQEELYMEGKTKTMNSKHLIKPFARAMDVAPYPIDWDDREKFVYMAGMVKGIAHCRNINIRWGGDWDGDNDFTDQSFNDLVHFELL